MHKEKFLCIRHFLHSAYINYQNCEHLNFGQNLPKIWSIGQKFLTKMIFARTIWMFVDVVFLSQAILSFFEANLLVSAITLAKVIFPLNRIV